MTKLVLPKIDISNLHGLRDACARLRPEDWVPQNVFSRWNEALAAKEDDEEKEATIDIYDVIGQDWFGNGWTAKRVAGILRNNKGRNVTVNLNSPGGDLFEGIAIYNILRDHDAEVTTRVVGLAASAGSVIAMAGDKIQVARAGFMMVHNVWMIAMGNRNDLRDAADQLETFDDALADVYAARTGQEKKAIAKMMDKETWFSGSQAIENGFADELLPADAVEEKKSGESASSSQAIRALEIDLMKAGYSRSRARARINELKGLLGTPDAAEPQDRGTPDAAPNATPDAGEVRPEVRAVIERLRAR